MIFCITNQEATVGSDIKCFFILQSYSIEVHYIRATDYRFYNPSNVDYDNCHIVYPTLHKLKCRAYQ